MGMARKRATYPLSLKQLQFSLYIIDQPKLRSSSCSHSLRCSSSHTSPDLGRRFKRPAASKGQR